MKNNEMNIPSTCLPEVLAVLNEVRQAKKEEEDFFRNRVRAEAKRVELRCLWKLRWICKVALWIVAVGGVSAVGTGIAMIRYFVMNHVAEKFDETIVEKIENRVEVLSRKTLNRLDATAEKAEGLASELDLMKAWSLAIGGDAVAYEKIREMSQTNEAARAYLNTADAFYAMNVQRKGNDSCVNEINWKYRRDGRPADEKIRLVKADPGVNKETLNLLIGLVAEDYENARQYTGLLVKKAGVCSNLMDRIQIIDCIHAMFDNCPKSPDLNKLQKWWAENRKPEYEAVR